MTTRAGSISKAHRLLAPRVAYLIGSRSRDGEANLIPVSNLTSVSTDPQLVVVAVHREWKTFENLTSAQGFTLSVPTFDQREGAWKLGARYSRYAFPTRAIKLQDCGLTLAEDPYRYGPVLADGLGWASCRLVQQLDVRGDHGVFLGEVVHVEFNEVAFTNEGVPLGGSHPLMQVTANLFTTAAEPSTIPYGD